jgi:hypothetical protein
VTGAIDTGEDDDDLLDLPRGDGAEEEEIGVADSEELLFNDLADEPEDVGLDTDPLGGGELAFGLVDDEEETQAGLLEDVPLELDAEIDAGEEEHGWTEDNESAGESWDDELPDELADEARDEDAGEEGVDDPLLDGLPEERPTDGAQGEADDDEAEDDAWADELSREIGAGA